MIRTSHRPLPFALASALTLLAAIAPLGTAQAMEPGVLTRVSLLVGFPDPEAEATGALVVPGTVIPIDLDGPPATSLDNEERRNEVLMATRGKLEDALRLEVEVSYTREIQMAVGQPRDLAGPGGSDLTLQVELLGFTERTATYQVKFFDRSAVIADSPVAVDRGKRAVVGGLDGEEAPYVFLIVEPAAEPGKAGDGPLFVGGDVTPPRALFKAPPQYTEEARKERTVGVVIVQAVIDETGAVAEVKALKTLPHGLTEAALDAIRQWRFEPAQLDGKPVAVYYNLTINFRLEKDKPED